MVRMLAKFTLRGVSSMSYGAGKYQRGDEITAGIGSATDRDLSGDRRWVRTIVKGADSSPDAGAAQLEARRLYAQLFGAISDLTSEVHGLPEDVRKAFAVYLVERRIEIGERFEELLVAAGVEDEDEDEDLEDEDLYRGRVMTDDEEADARGGDDNDDPEIDDDPEPDLDLEPEADPEPPKVDPMDAQVQAEGLDDLEAALEAGKGTKGDLVEYATRGGLQVDPNWENSPSAGGLSAGDLRARLAELLAAARAA